MTTYATPLMIITLFVVVLSPIATGWVSDLTIEMANHTASLIDGQGR